ncbi:hypothetical protein QN382_01135 [Pseudomonas sp. 10B1]|uniref:hypothetical protein n=1 Tax=unclassified Pseudomonas TaxID=196821 RepID=UPI002AB5B6F8|nr:MULTISPECIES: hypothetical protein [unclassified Pseudomonas]MDY7560555.1 hypothetical protein [Pseudomonas sp. AB6]MEA9975851.1 hypothetical protein [Pseudomonas sp. RTS4]MEA9993311.1 hypothetical protein [Pseudomonas sp. AA4]MEB0088499.1 hypothetical protein [Pseudomonas sp. RTI1]MEB0124202.1 hypothetical protein [Pseudomonas sp. CCC1.2]
MNVNPNTRLHSWMGQNAAFATLRIDQLILPGSHDSAADKMAPGGYFFETTQDVSPIDQVKGGVRVLDLRVEFLPQHEVGHPKRFTLFHVTYTGRTLTTDIFEPLNEFLNGVKKAGDTAREIIILDFHTLKNFTPDAHVELNQLITHSIGHRVIPWDLRKQSVSQLWYKHPGKNIVLAYSGRLSPQFWPSVQHQWIGENFPNTTTLKAFMDTRANAPKSDYYLRSIQCAKYVIAPDDFSPSIDEWFESVDENSYIQGFHIINTDWTLRSSIVKNCIHACLVRALNR